MRSLAAIIALVIVSLTTCARDGGFATGPDWRAATTDPTRTTRLSKPPRTATPAPSATSSSGATEVVPDPAAHPACRLLDWADLPADVRPDRPPTYVTYEDRPDECRIDNSLIGVAAPLPGEPDPGGGGTVEFFAVRAIVSDDLSPIEQFAEPTDGSTARTITVGGLQAVERSGCMWNRRRGLRGRRRERPVPPAHAVRPHPPGCGGRAPASPLNCSLGEIVRSLGVAVRLEPAEFNLLWTGLALGTKPLELNVPAQGATLTEAARLTSRATEALRERDLLLGDEPVPRVADLLHLVAGRTAQVDLRWAPGIGQPELRGLAALRGKHGALALWDGEWVTLRRVRPVVFVEELVGTLGEAPMGAGRSVSLPAELLARASRDGAGDVERFQRRLVSGGASRDDARLLREFVAAGRLRAGQLGASAFDTWGKARRVPWVIHVLDTDRGRYATYERGGYRTVVGVDSGWLVAVVRELYADAVRDHRNS